MCGQPHPDGLGGCTLPVGHVCTHKVGDDDFEFRWAANPRTFPPAKAGRNHKPVG